VVPPLARNVASWECRHQSIYEEAQTNLKPFEAITVFMRTLSTVAAKDIPDGSLDFVYIDARHDYCGAAQDLATYYPKIKPGACHRSMLSFYA
jgi:hypothetical protein